MLGLLISMPASGWRRRRRKKAASAATETAVAVRKYANALFPLSWGTFGPPSSVPALSFLGAATDSTEIICAMQGNTPATACPVMIACVYSPTPNPETYAKTPFWQKPVARLAVNTIAIRKPKYTPAETPRKRTVERARRVKATMLSIRERMMRLG